jgi:uncharacterized protein YkwD
MKRKFATFLLIGMLFSSAVPVYAFSLTSPLKTVSSALNGVVNRLSDLVYFLSQQKKYIFDNFSDPNDYGDLSGSEKVVEKVEELKQEITPDLSKKSDVASTTTEKKPTVSTAPSVPRVNTGTPVIISTTTIPEVKKVITPSAPVVSSPTVTETVTNSVPALIFPPISIPDSLKDLRITISATQVGTDYDSSDILIFTNKERSKKSLLPLSGNKTLDKIAKQRLDDLFDNQYFAHESPDGRSAPDLAKKAGYAYLLIGENLALGSFDGDEGILDAWMDSPGHRANILNNKYRELGVAKGVGRFNDGDVTIAVQIFGNPQSTCAKPNPEAKKKIDEVTVEIKKAQTDAQNMLMTLNLIKDSPDLDRSFYNQKIQEYNYYAKNINLAVTSLKDVVTEYNSAVQNYNSCIKN